MSEETAMLGQARVVGDSSQSNQQTTNDSGPHMSIDDLLKVIKGANGRPVLFVPSSDGRLAAVAVDGLQNLVLANRGNDGSAKKKQHDLRAWLLLLASLVATVSFSAALTPPGGFWSEDSKEHVAGTPIIRDKFPGRYKLFVSCNMVAFFFSVVIIGMLASNMSSKSKLVLVVRFFYFPFLVACCLAALGTSFICCMWPYDKIDSLACVAFAFALMHLTCFYALDRIKSRNESQERTPESSA